MGLELRLRFSAGRRFTEERRAVGRQGELLGYADRGPSANSSRKR